MPLIYWEGTCDICQKKLQHLNFYVSEDGSVKCYKHRDKNAIKFKWEWIYYSETAQHLVKRKSIKLKSWI